VTAALARVQRFWWQAGFRQTEACQHGQRRVSAGGYASFVPRPPSAAPYLTVTGAFGSATAVVAVLLRGWGHRNAVRKFGEGKMGPGPDAGPGLPPGPV
jgi:hypothetical protein